MTATNPHRPQEADVLQTRDEISRGLVDELAAFAALVRPLSPAEMAVQTRCDGWTVADVAAHFIGSMTDVVEGRLEGLGSAEVTAREVAERVGRTAGELADEADAANTRAVALLGAMDDAAWSGPGPADFDGTLGDGVEALWFDGYVHADDIRHALGDVGARPRTGGLVASVSHVAFHLTRQGWGPADLELDGVAAVKVGGGGSRTVTGDPHAFVLAATGRLDPAVLGLDPAVNIYRLG